jgi:hypothetical protein
MNKPSRALLSKEILDPEFQDSMIEALKKRGQ